MKTFLKFLLIFLSSVVGIILAGTEGLLSLILKYDFSYLSFVILSLYFIFSIYNAITCLTRKNITKHLNVTSFAANNFVSLGLLGTVVGLIYSMFVSMDNSDTGMMIAGLKEGLATSLITTGVGIVANVLLQLQNFVIEHDLKD